MKYIAKILVLLLLLAGKPSFAIHDSLINVLFYSLEKKGGNLSLSLDNGKLHNNIKFNWLYFPYDSKKHSINNPNDSGYTIINQTDLFYFEEEDDDEKEKDEIDFDGFGWYKLYFKVPTGLDKKTYAIFYSQLGATEVYFDGQLLDKCGIIGADGKTIEAVKSTGKYASFFIGDTLPHVLALRHSSSDYKLYYDKYNFSEIGPYVRFSRADIADDETIYQNIFFNVSNMISAFFLALFCIHLLIYFFYKDKVFNLYYSLFLLFLALSLFELYCVGFIESPKGYIIVDHFDSLFFPACCFFLVTLLNKLLNVKRTWHYIGFVILFVLLIIDTFLFTGFSASIITSMIFYTYFNTLAHAIVGIRRKIPSAKFLGWGVLGFTISIIILIVMSFIIAALVKDDGGKSVKFVVLYIYIIDIIIGILSIPLSMTAYLAYDFSRTNKHLSDQLKANEELNKKSLEQEKEKQEILENQNKVLETQVEQRTKEIANQNKILEHQKKEITDSINYAKRIQQALLPEIESIKSALPNSFVYYVPKDIVSGDFYFFNSFSEIKDHPGRKDGTEEAGVFIAAADCTGHGVPGALMSMIVHEKLEAAIKIHNEPGQILHSINKQVKDALKQHQTDASRDGCDIALCKIQGNTLSYAGAYRPLYLFYKNGDFVEIKATKTAIAGLTPYDQKFTEHQFNIPDLKAVYMFSDGYADQFGGQKSKKLTTKKFKELLKTLVNLPVNEQNIQLESFFNGWRGNVEQIDDVLVIGLTF